MAPNAAKPKARVRQPGRQQDRQPHRQPAGGRGRQAGRRAGQAGETAAMRAVVWPPGCPWPGVWMWPGPFGTEGPGGLEGTGGAGAPGGPAPEWSPVEFRRALGIAIAIVLAGLLIGALIAAWAGGVISGPARLFGMMRLLVRPLGKSRAESPGEPPGGITPARPGALPERPSPGYPAPGADCRTISGERVRLGDCADDVMLLTFFSTASGPSLAHVSVLAEMHIERLEGARILAVAVCQAQDSVASYMEARKLDLPVIADPRGELARLYDITAVPTTFVIDTQGIVRDLRVGAMTRSQLERAVRSAL